MKYKTTRKEIMRHSNDVICLGYCDAQALLHNHQPVAYNAGLYGWNYDVYEVCGKTICTGYRNMPGRRANNVAEYEIKARKILDDYARDYKERSADIETLLRQFCEQA